MSSIKVQLGLDRDALIGLAVLLGCDYLPKGVPGVGKEQALKLIQILKGQSLLQRFDQWNEKSHSNPQPAVTKKPAHCSVCSHPGSPKDHERSGCRLCKSDRYCEPHDYEYCCPCEWHQTEYNRQLTGVEENIKKKACRCEGFPFQEVIQEFLLNKDKLVKVIRYQRPDLLLFQRFTLEKMEWPNHYACEKLLVLLTRYDMIERKLGRRNSNQLQPIRIVKNRIRNGIHCFEIEWERPEHYITEDKQNGGLVLSTIEEESLFEAAYPEIVAVYQLQKLEIKGKKQKGLKIKSKENLPDSDDAVTLQSEITLKSTCEIFPKQNSKLNLEISPNPTLPQETIPASLNDFHLPEVDDFHFNTQEHFLSSPRPLAIQQIKAASKYPTSDAGQPSSSFHNRSEIADLHLSTIDWEGTSFSNSPAIQRNTFSCGIKSELKSELSAIADSSENIPEQLCESEQCTSNINKVLDWDFQKINPEEHLLSGISDLCLQDLPLRERLQIKSSYPQDNVQTDVDLKTLSLIRVKESCIANSTDCPSHLSKDLPGINLQNESKNTEVVKGQLLQENYKITTSVSFPGNNTTAFRARPPNTALHHSRKVDTEATKKIIMKKSVCLDRHSSDEESTPVFEKAKYSTQKIKHGFQNDHPARFKENDHNNLNNPKLLIKETEKYINPYKTAGNEENCFPDLTKKSLNFPQCPQKVDHHPGICLDSPLPLSQRLKLRFKNT